MYTYASNQVLLAAGNHAVTGYAEDSFIVIDPHGDGIMKKVGCDGEVSRAVSPDNTYTVKISLAQGSPSNKFFQGMYERDRTTGNGVFPLLIKDLTGGVVFSADSAWVGKPAPRTYGKDTNAREWEIATGPAVYKE